VARRAAAQLGLAHFDGGTIFRQLAADAGLTLAEFGRRAELRPEIDLEVDRRLAERAKEGGVVLESRLAGWIALNEGLEGLRVWLECREDVRASRVAVRDGLDAEKALETNRTRERSERSRYRSYYGIDLDDLGPYDRVLDSAASAPDELVATIVGAIW
jgi:CMP/dCMP kinase